MKRPDNMSYEEYKRMRTLDNKILKLYSKGRVIWDSRKKGTYVKSKHGKIGGESASSTYKSAEPWNLLQE